jgi:hypothetical protein
MMQNIHGKLNAGLPRKKPRSARRRRLFTTKLELHLKNKLLKCYIWSVALYGAETWTLRKLDQIYLESFEI